MKGVRPWRLTLRESRQPTPSRPRIRRSVTADVRARAVAAAAPAAGRQSTPSMRPRWRSWLKLRRPPATAGAAGRAADLHLASVRRADGATANAEGPLVHSAMTALTVIARRGPSDCLLKLPRLVSVGLTGVTWGTASSSRPPGPGRSSGLREWRVSYLPRPRRHDLRQRAGPFGAQRSPDASVNAL
jgi:hypothetical protein